MANTPLRLLFFVVVCIANMNYILAEHIKLNYFGSNVFGYVYCQYNKTLYSKAHNLRGIKNYPLCYNFQSFPIQNLLLYIILLPVGSVLAILAFVPLLLIWLIHMVLLFIKLVPIIGQVNYINCELISKCFSSRLCSLSNFSSALQAVSVTVTGSIRTSIPKKKSIRKRLRPYSSVVKSVNCDQWRQCRFEEIFYVIIVVDTYRSKDTFLSL